jgi:acetyl-CoA carboxylase biotin carboxylase subunit
MVTGVDLVQWQIRIARGERLTLDAERALTPRGHAIECRIYAEDPDRQFMPSPGTIVALRAPAGPGIRDDSGVTAGSSVPVFYDSLISKLVGWGSDRPAAIARLNRALGEYRIAGVRTTIPFFRWLLTQPEFTEGRFDTTFLDRVLASRTAPFSPATDADEEIAAMAAALDAYFRVGAGAGSHGRAPEGAWKRAARLESLRS